MNIYIDIDKPVLQNPVLSVSNSTPDDSALNFVSGDKIPINIFFTQNGAKYDNYHTTGSDSASYYVAIGRQASATPYTSTNNFYISHSWGVTSSLDLNTAGVTGSFNGEDYVNATIQVSVTQPSGSANRVTYVLKPCVIYNAVDN